MRRPACNVSFDCSTFASPITSDCQNDTDFLPFLSASLPSQTANATGTVIFFLKRTPEPADNFLFITTVHRPFCHTPLPYTSCAFVPVIVPNPSASKFSTGVFGSYLTNSFIARYL